jgi:hypothetical protein
VRDGVKQDEIVAVVCVVCRFSEVSDPGLRI